MTEVVRLLAVNGTTLEIAGIDLLDQWSVNLASYVGQTIRIKWTGSEDYTNQTSFVLDDTALNVR